LVAEITSKNPEEYVMSLNKNVTDSDTASESDSEPDDPATSSSIDETMATNSETVNSTTSSVSMPRSESSLNITEIPEDFTYDEMPIALLMRESLPGLNYVDVNPEEAAFVVASNPLTKTHTWNPMPRNSIMWCTRGKMPELRLLRSKKPKHRSIVSDHTIVL